MLSCLLNNQRINCFDKRFEKEQLKKWSNKDILLCPVCKKPYEYCHGKVKSPYFRHKDKLQCVDKFSEPETEEHIKGKKDLYEWLISQPNVEDCVLEGWIPETKQRPDIMFKCNGELCVLEYQCSPISTEYLERHELYKAAGIKDIWILGTDKYLCKEENPDSKSFREKEIEKHTSYYYDSEYQLFFSKCNWDILQLMFNCNYDKKNARSFKEVLRSSRSYAICNLNNMSFEKCSITLGKECNKYIDSLRKEYITAEYITKYATKYLKKRYQIRFVVDQYDKYTIEHERLCFRIDVKNKQYICFEKYFTKSYYYQSARRKEKWIQHKRNICVKNVDRITWNGFIVFTISSLLKFQHYKNIITNKIRRD